MPLTAVQRTQMFSIYSPKNVPKTGKLKKLPHSRTKGMPIRTSSKTKMNSQGRYNEKPNFMEPEVLV